MCRRPGPEGALLLALALAAAVAGARAGERSLPVDCFPDEVVAWNAAGPDPDLRFGASWLPGIVLGPPGDSLANTGSTSAASLGNGGSAVLAFRDLVIEDGPGPDFILFENPFFVGAAPASPDDPYLVFVEPGVVEVSLDGETWVALPFDADALADATSTAADPDLYLRLQGLAGVTPTLTGDWTVVEDPLVWDPAGTGGVSGAGGDAFDLADAGVTEARYLRVTDGNSVNGVPGTAEGFDLDAVVVLHGRPDPPLTTDTDGDRLADLAETSLYGTDPLDPDSDGDGVDDGREVAACRDPSSAAEGATVALEPRLWLRDGPCTEVRWTFLGTGIAYDLARGNLSDLAEAGGTVDLGALSCLTSAQATVQWSCDDAAPAPGEGYFYVARAAATGAFGRSSGLSPRQTAAACP
jgi:hypothetical protein